MSTPWSPPLLRDAIGRGDGPSHPDPARRLGPRWAERVAALDAALTAWLTVPDAPLPTVRCDCERTVLADLLVDVRAVPAAVRTRPGATEPQEFACDACVQRWHLTRVLTPSELAAHLGAPPERLARIAEKWASLERPASPVLPTEES